MYIMILQRTNSDSTTNMAITQANQLADEMQEVIERSMSCAETSTGIRERLVCVLPAGGTDIDDDGVMDVFTPSTVDNDGRLTYQPGQVVEFYWSNATGTILSTTDDDSFLDGPYLWRAHSPATGGTSTPDRTWSRTGRMTWYLIYNIDFQHEPGKSQTKMTILAKVLYRKPTRPANPTNNLGTTFTLTRIIPWRNAP